MQKFKFFILTPVLMLAFVSSSLAQQFFVKTWAFSQDGETVPNYEPMGSYQKNNNSDVILYGTVNYSEGELDGTQGGAELLINKNDVDGNPIYALTIGTSENEHVNRVIEDKNGDLVITINQENGGSYDGHLIKVDVVNNSGTYSFSVAQQREFTKTRFYDLIEIRSYQGPGNPPNIDGYAFIAQDLEADKSILGSVNNNLNHAATGHWIKYFEHTSLATRIELASLIQVRIPYLDDEGNISGSAPFNRLAVVGKIEGGTELTYVSGSSAYMALVNIYSGAVFDDFHAGIMVSGCGRYYRDTYPKRFSEVVQDIENGGYVCLSQTVEGHVEGGSSWENAAYITKVQGDLDKIEWVSRTLLGSDPNNVMCQLDLLNTEMFYSVVLSDPDNSEVPFYTVANFLKDGQFQEHRVFAHANGTSGLGSSFEGYGEEKIGQQFTKDFALECNDRLHFPAITYGPAPMGWNASYFTEKGVTHGKASVGGLDLLCLNDQHNETEEYCDDLDVHEAYDINVVWGQTTTDIQPTTPEFFLLATHSASFYEHENCSSDCEEYACEPTIIEQFVCPDAFDPGSDNLTLYVPHATADVKDVIWFDGSTGLSTEIFAIGTYDLVVNLLDGCVIYYDYVVQEYPEINLQATVTEITCNGDNDAEICFTSDINIVSATIGYVYGQQSYSNQTVSIGATSFCFTDLIASLHGESLGLEPGTYTITVVDDNGCTEMYTYTITDPSAIVISTTNPLCDNPNTSAGEGELIISVTGGVPTYFMSVYKTSSINQYSVPNYLGVPPGYVDPIDLPMSFPNLEARDPATSPIEPWFYEVNVFDSRGCFKKLTNVTVSICPPPPVLSVTEVHDQTIRIFPNPTTGSALVTSSLATEFQLFSTTGELVMSGQLNEGETQLDISALANGIYTLKADGQSLRIIKE